MLTCYSCRKEIMEGYLLNTGKIYCEECYKRGGKTSGETGGSFEQQETKLGSSPDVPST